MDTRELAEALRILGVMDPTLVSEPDTTPGITLGTIPGKARGPWLACSLDCEGTVRLWPSFDSAGRAPGSGDP